MTVTKHLSLSLCSSLSLCHSFSLSASVSLSHSLFLSLSLLSPSLSLSLSLSLSISLSLSQWWCLPSFDWQLLQIYQAKLQYLGFENLIEWVTYVCALLLVIDFETCQKSTGFRFVRSHPPQYGLFLSYQTSTSDRYIVIKTLCIGNQVGKLAKIDRIIRIILYLLDLEIIYIYLNFLWFKQFYKMWVFYSCDQIIQ